MKKTFLSLVVTALMLLIIPAQANEGTPMKTTTTMSKGEIEVLVKRVNEIKAMDKSMLNSTEKKALRKELRAIKKEVNSRNGGIYYISGSLILLIIILIILL